MEECNVPARIQYLEKLSGLQVVARFERYDDVTQFYVYGKDKAVLAKLRGQESAILYMTGYIDGRRS